jgi:hypothetical protein
MTVDLESLEVEILRRILATRVRGNDEDICGYHVAGVLVVADDDPSDAIRKPEAGDRAGQVGDCACIDGRACRRRTRSVPVAGAVWS